MRTTSRAVPVSQALKSLIPVQRIGRSSTVQATAIHQPVVTANTRPTIPVYSPVELRVSTIHSSSWHGLAVGVAGAIFLAILVATTSSPQTTPTAQGEVLGAAISRPLRVTVNVIRPNRQVTVITAPATGTLVEALAETSRHLGGGFAYTTRGSSIYPAMFAGQIASAAGHWTVAVNNQPATDLSQVTLRQDDRITITWVQ